MVYETSDNNVPTDFFAKIYPYFNFDKLQNIYSLNIFCGGIYDLYNYFIMSLFQVKNYNLTVNKGV